MLGSRDPLLEFWDPQISPERLKLETSNLAQRWTAVSTNEKMQNWVKRGHVGSRDPLLDFWDPPNISGMNEASNFKFGSEMDGSEY